MTTATTKPVSPKIGLGTQGSTQDELQQFIAMLNKNCQCCTDKPCTKGGYAPFDLETVLKIIAKSEEIIK